MRGLRVQVFRAVMRVPNFSPGLNVKRTHALCCILKPRLQVPSRRRTWTGATRCGRLSVCGFERRMYWMSVSVVRCSLSVRVTCFDFSVSVLFCRAQFNCMPVPRKSVIYTFFAWSVRMVWPRRALNPKPAFHTNEGSFAVMFFFIPCS